jgi:hypothetical protein
MPAIALPTTDDGLQAHHGCYGSLLLRRCWLDWLAAGLAWNAGSACLLDCWICLVANAGFWLELPVESKAGMRRS